MSFAGFERFCDGLSDRHETFVKVHLKNVYSCLAMSALAASVGAYVHVATSLLQNSLITTLIGLGLLFLLLGTPDNGKNRSLRLGYLLGFSFLSGLGVGPLIQHVIYIDPAIISTAFLGTGVIFIGFTLSSLYSEQRRWLYLGGILSSGLSLMFLMSLLSIFYPSAQLMQFHSYLGLIVLSGFVMYDTQLIVEKRRRGDQDFIRHSLDLFIDLIGIFRHLLIILANKEQQKRNSRRSDRN